MKQCNRNTELLLFIVHAVYVGVSDSGGNRGSRTPLSYFSWKAGCSRDLKMRRVRDGDPFSSLLLCCFAIQ